MLQFLLGLLIGGFVGFAIMCLMQIAHHCDEEKPQKSSENLTRFDNNEKITIGSVFPMYLENVEYPVIYIGDLAVNSRSGNGRA